jgi:hypothetical protein
MSKNTQTHGGGPWTVVYSAPNSNHKQFEVTNNVPATVASLQAAGFVIIDIIEGG